ncbi:hypothetical protein R3P38DRAFT_3238257 [Favolaschia claudopus]|uniref:Uncharacterized protein n=1 Tax=Favolaschia claudopus TaxID=2862362 RepID=A0AAV9ZA71_9AGAR
MADDLHFRYTSLSPSDFFPPPPPPSPACIRSVHNDFALEDNEPHSFFSSMAEVRRIPFSFAVLTSSTLLVLRCNGPRDFGEIELEDGVRAYKFTLRCPFLLSSTLSLPALSDMLVEDVDGNCVHPNELQLSFDGHAPERSPVGSELTTRSSTSSLFGSEDDTRERETLDEVLATDNLELGHVEEQEQVHSSNERDFMSDIVLDGDFEANTQVEGGGGTAVSVTSDSLDRPVVYYGE